MNATFTIDALSPMALLDTANILDNEYYRWCADSVTDETGRFLNDDELTYNDFEFGPDYILPAGTRVVMPHLWGWHNEGGLTSATDYEIVLPKAATVKHVVLVILSQYYTKLESEDAGGRYFYIEDVIWHKDGTVEIVWGT